MAEKDPDELAGTEQPFVSHLVELRDRLIRASIAVLACAAVLFFYPGPSALYDLLAAPLVAHLPAGGTLIATNVISPFLVPMKITLMAAFLIALPVVLYQAWAFIAPGLYLHEKKMVLPLVVSSTLLFFLGVAFCYFFVFGKVFTFIQSFAPKSVSAMSDIEAYLSFVLTMPRRASTTTAIGTSKAAPKAMNIVMTKLRYASMSGIAETLFGATLWMNVNTLPKTKK